MKNKAGFPGSYEYRYPAFALSDGEPCLRGNILPYVGDEIAKMGA